MARIRTIKPEFWTNEQVADCSTTARLLFVGMWTFCDDGGNHPASFKTLKMEIFPGDDFSLDDICVMVQQLIRNGLIVEYEVESKRYWHVTGWHHQKIEKPNKRHPSPDQGVVLPPVADQSPNDRLPVADQSPPESSLKESSLKESSLKETPPTPSRMTLSGVRTAFREIIGVELGGGVNQALSEICQTYTPEAINDAMLRTSTRVPRPTNPFMHFKGTLEGRARERSSPENSSQSAAPADSFSYPSPERAAKILKHLEAQKAKQEAEDAMYAARS